MLATSLTNIIVGGSSQYTRLYCWAAFLAFCTRTRASGPIPLYTRPMFLQTIETLSSQLSSTNGDVVFFSVAMTMPFVAVYLFVYSSLSHGAPGM